jgi:hypothetical protein
VDAKAGKWVGHTNEKKTLYIYRMPREMLPAPKVGGATLASAQGPILISSPQEKRACIASADMPRHQRSG